MVLFLKERKHTSLFVITVLVLVELCFTSTDSHIAKGNILKQRRKRQVSDLVLIGYKAKGALKSTTRHPEYFRRIGKKWSHLSKPSLSEEDRHFLQQAGIADVYVNKDENAQKW